MAGCMVAGRATSKVAWPQCSSPSARLAELPAESRPNVVVACTVNEEYGFTGAKGLAQLWHDQHPFFPHKPAAVIVTEPTNLNVVTVHRGVVRWRLRTSGIAAHSSLPQLGDNAIYRMSPLLWALKRYERDKIPQLGTHPLCGSPSISVGTIHGGISVNTVPDECIIEIERRILPGDDAAEAYRDVVEWVTAQAYDPKHVEHEPPFMSSNGLSDKLNSTLAKQLAAVSTGARLRRGD